MKMTHSDLVMLRGNHKGAIASRELIRVKRGVAIAAPKQSEALPRWEAFSTAAEARILAVARTMRREVVFTRESAMLIHGLPCWAHNPCVSIRVAGSFTPSLLPGVIMSTHQIPAVRLRSTHGKYTEAQPQRIGGLLVDSLEETALQMALKARPLDAVIAVSGIIKALSRFDRFRQPASRRREEIVKAGLLDGLRGLGSIPGKRQAEAVLTLSDAGCETIGEQALLFTLATVMPYEIHTQHEVVIRGHSYFLDFAIPSLKIAFEFDGLIKMGEDRESFQRAHRALLSRQRELEDAGWTVIRVAWEELMDLAALRAKLVGRVARCTSAPIVSPVQGEALWNRQLITSRVARSRTRA
ncbi:hypothetical protein HMPREF9004_0362 [Schaalia cardiffensis F0333]|uniref:DUF559 domain-containing protein n=1 Tax=Schaalia cardiffensis F0333 TaxID=888050 RepID=N6X6L9_9ACTO|nr:hypothetical protein [Schaalia cardiffensis]ENO19027.1 hypothetical protein HMPREF9004_0362 [Schaalia cardiffensis F0333]